jgi:hypothetical protein
MYDASQTGEKEEEKGEQSIYAPLIAPAPEAGGPPPTASTPASAPAPTNGPSFVSFDKILNANRGVVDKQRADMQASVDNRADKVKTGLDTQLQAIQGIIKPPESTTNVSRQLNEIYANAQYIGPTQKDVDSKYQALLADRNKLNEEAAAAKSGYFGLGRGDNALLAGAGGVNYGQADAASKELEADFKGASDNVTNAQAEHEKTKSAWQKLLDYRNNVADPAAARQSAEDAKKTERANRLAAASDALTGTMGKEAAAQYREILAKMPPDLQDRFMDLDPKKLGVVNYYQALQQLYEDAIRAAPDAFIKR